jgi:hypothetical protein
MAKLVTYTAHLPPDVVTPEQVSEKTILVKDGFSFPAFVFGGFWLLAQRLWLPAFVFLLALGGVMLTFWWFGLPRPAYGIVSTLMSLLVGIEGNEWLRRGLSRRGFRHVETVSGTSLAECERTFFARWLAASDQPKPQPPARSSGPEIAPFSRAPVSQPGIIGLFPDPAAGTGGPR